MLFSSQIFLLVFLPIVLAGYHAMAGSRAARLTWLLVASFWFYGYWDIRLLPLLAGSICANWVIGRLLARRSFGLTLGLGLVVNLGLLGIFKYADFAALSFCALAACQHEPWSFALPLGISFFTFQQISYLIDVRRMGQEGNKDGAREYHLADYALYVAFFPQLIAGPIVRHDELIPQFAADPRRPGFAERMSRGAILFLIGLAKKFILANQLAHIADPLFGAAAQAEALSLAEAWLAALSFSLQIYFDFSAYSDMAIGLGLMFGFTLPTNFNAPYRSTSIRDFWQRWHMTLSRFFRDYVYIPLGGNRLGPWRQLAALAVAWFLTGLWHGAAWTFVVWGLIHGSAIIIFLMWRRFGVPLPRWFGWLLTMVVVMVAFVVFRADSFASALHILGAMVDWVNVGPPARDLPRLWLLPVACLVIALPTSRHLAEDILPPRRVLAAACGVLFVYIALELGGSKDHVEFIYFQF